MTTSPPNLPVTAPPFAARYFKAKMILAGVLVVCAFLAVGFKSIFSIQVPNGSPLAESVRAGNHIVTLIQTLEPYVVSLHRNPENNRYAVALFVAPVDGSSRKNMIPIGKGFRSSELQLARVLGFDGITVWCLVDKLHGVNLTTGKLVDAAKLQNANPRLVETWDDPRRMTFDARLQVASSDRQRILEVEPESLKASSIREGRNAATLPSRTRLENFLSVGARPSPNRWLALLSSREAELPYKPKSWLQPINRAESARVMRRIYVGQLGPELARGNREILGLTALSANEYFNGAFVRSGPEIEPTRLSSPDGFLMAYTASPALGATLMVARVTTDGKIVWSVDTGLDRFLLKQILPDGPFPAFVGTRPAVPNKVSEPLLVIINTQTGGVSSTSLWQ